MRNSPLFGSKKINSMVTGTTPYCQEHRAL
jgi:hypothetical protein